MAFYEVLEVDFLFVLLLEKIVGEGKDHELFGVVGIKLSVTLRLEFISTMSKNIFNS